ncbi:transmembrane protein, putative (macronuclear) [Tetrahymena thermophila SB210]|uniref:Transmembrane protein, putative n=1 Tax=Tetrahymena thermophila (strain SB210) TaxID=312017 RepID=Q22X05_TETTS|nr:transmembrane protein, putative [Tetrahymena thermophila SB210]EAR89841.2 transmembrane protein, putative [Tetrahymena thermophila SB210]|eukprot:XP_001010086.2 transmembrane protein, putative [Tetrahymena thermophila SB210]
MNIKDKTSIQVVDDSLYDQDPESRAQSVFDLNKLYVFPGSMEKALIHREANSLGEEVQQSVRLMNEVCECCKKVVKEKKLNFFCLSENKNILKWGWGVPQYLTIQKLNIILLTLVFFFYCGEFIVASNKLCDNISQFDLIIPVITCDESFKMQIVPEIVLKIFFQNLKYGKFTALVIVLGFLIVFYFYVQFFYRKQYLNQEDSNQQNIKDDNITSRSILVLNFPDLSQDKIEEFFQHKIKEKLGLNIKPKIEQICKIYNYQKLSSIFQEYIKMYEKMNVQKENLTQKDKQKAQELKQKIDLIKQNGASYSYRVIVTFQYQQDCIIVKNSLRRSFIYDIVNYILVRKMKKFTTTDYCTIKSASHPKDYIWVNLGRSIKSKMRYLTLSVIVFSILIGGLGYLLYLMTQALNNLEGNENQDIDTSTRVVQYSISFGIFAIEKIILTFLKYVSLKSLHFNKTSQFRFYINYATTFLLAYYVTLPCYLFFLISSDSLFSTQQQKVLRTSSFLNEMVVQLAMSISLYIFDFQFILHFYKKFKIQKMFKQTGKIELCQINLNLAMQKPELNLEKRFILIFKLLAFTGFYIFICPYSVLFILGASIILYLIDKYMIIIRYSIYSYRSAKYIKSSATLLTTWMVFIVISVFFLTEGEQINFTISQGVSDNYNLSLKYYVVLYIILGIFIFINIIQLIIYPIIKNKLKLKKAINQKEEMQEFQTYSQQEINQKLLPFNKISQSFCQLDKDNTNSYIYYYQLFISQFDCKILDDFYNQIL